MELNMELLQELVNLVKNARISELTVRVGDWRVTIRKFPETVTTSSTTVASPQSERREVATAEKADETRPYVPVVSNWVGIVRRLKNDKPLVQVGDKVKQGQTLCWIDTLGVQNEVRSPVAGRIVEIFVEDGQAVEFGQQIMLVEVSTGG
ncbi:MAG: acetyl-CoA carboxylase biotin carboxyl carrier protein [Candidatus Fervidibacter sp.]|uniref:acetyl-CoA carboxylase biotin carboxyl carrier protein n=1 Tax=Candidatus Fervidibacter sp. TaxID=3100871 RepID=UPI00404A2207